MRGAWIGRWAHAGALLVAAFSLTFSALPAQADRAGDFDFYVLSLSWSPTYCEDRGSQDRIQCDGRQPFAFVVHGLWPQYERGYPSDCPSPFPDFVPRSLVNTLLDIMPSPGLIGHEWKTHGRCSGLDQRSYFAQIRKAAAAIHIPPEFTDVEDTLRVTPASIESAFIEANPGLRKDGIAVACDAKRLKEVRICLTRDLRFRACAEVDRDSCRRDQLIMPPVR